MPHTHSPQRAAAQRARLGAASVSRAPEVWASTARRRGAQAMARSHQLRVPTPTGLCRGPRLPLKPPPGRSTAPPCKCGPALSATSRASLPSSPPGPSTAGTGGLSPASCWGHVAAPRRKALARSPLPQTGPCTHGTKQPGRAGTQGLAGTTGTTGTTGTMGTTQRSQLPQHRCEVQTPPASAPHCPIFPSHSFTCPWPLLLVPNTAGACPGTQGLSRWQRLNRRGPRAWQDPQHTGASKVPWVKEAPSGRGCVSRSPEDGEGLRAPLARGRLAFVSPESKRPAGVLAEGPLLQGTKEMEPGASRRQQALAREATGTG